MRRPRDEETKCQTSWNEQMESHSWKGHGDPLHFTIRYLHRARVQSASLMASSFSFWQLRACSK